MVEQAIPFPIWAVIFACSGMVALALEIVWFRLLTVMMKGTAFTFGTLLGIYLIGIGAGSLAGSSLARRIQRPAVAFLTLQALVGLSAIGLLAIFIRRADDIGALSSYFGSYEPISVRASVNALLGRAVTAAAGVARPADFLTMYVVIPTLLVLPPTLLMGAAFPVLQKVVQHRIAFVGRRVGTLLLANVVGSMAGTVLTGWWLLDRVGTGGTLRILALVSATFAALAAYLAVREVRDGWIRRLIPIAATIAAFGILIAVLPSTGTIWAHLHGTVVEAMELDEDGSGLAVITNDTTRATVFVNGIGQSTLPYGGVHTALGAIPAFLHPSPRRAAVIGLGSGDTTYAVAGRPEIEGVDSIEIIRGQIATLRSLRGHFGYNGLQNLLDDGRVTQVFADGRIYLRRGGPYDIIEADALRPTSAYSGNLYSDAYFALVRERLAPGGLAATWAPPQRVYNTFIRAFPYVVGMPGILVGSQQPIEVDRDAILARLRDPRAKAHFDQAGVNIEALVMEHLEKIVRYGPEFARDQLGEINTDLFPRDEFDLAP
jgi:predicted membrane-bound spermidine synthase